MRSHSGTQTRILPEKVESWGKDLIDQIGSLFIQLKIRPNGITIVALSLGFISGILFSFGKHLLGGIAIILCGFMDILDGRVATNTNRTSLFGAIFDSALDRYSEFFIYIGLAVYFRHSWPLWITFWTFLGSTMVSYTRARAEGLGFECKIGIMQRAERLTILALGSIIGSIFNIIDPVLIGVLLTIAVFSNITAIQRILHVKKLENQRKNQNGNKTNGKN